MGVSAEGRDRSFGLTKSKSSRDSLARLFERSRCFDCSAGTALLPHLSFELWTILIPHSNYRVNSEPMNMSVPIWGPSVRCAHLGASTRSRSAPSHIRYDYLVHLSNIYIINPHIWASYYAKRSEVISISSQKGPNLPANELPTSFLPIRRCVSPIHALRALSHGL